MAHTLFAFEGAPVRVVDIDGDVWFAAKDVAERLGYANAADAVSKHCRGVAKRYPLSTAGGVQEIRVLAEADVLRLIVGSKLPAAQRFERWVFEEVLPAVRKTGGYLVARPDETQEELVLRAMGVLKATVDRQRAELEAAMPKALALDRIAQAQGSLNITDAAKALQMPPKQLFEWLQKHEWIYRRDGRHGRWIGYQKRVTSGDLEHKVSVLPQDEGPDRITEQVRITPQGLTKLAKLIQRAAA